jgi:CMP-N-acetylneuraminic acid synthetase
MYKGKRVLAVIPARGGSKGIPLKNLALVGGVPLVTRAARVSCAVAAVDCTVVSTDNEEIAAAAIAGGAQAPFRRPPELSGDQIADHPVLLHALTEMERRRRSRFDIVLMLQPTSPMRRPAHIEAALELLVSQNVDAVWSLSPTDTKAHPLKQHVVKDGLLQYYDPRAAQITARQQLERLYHRNGLVYAFTRGFLLQGNTIKAERTAALISEEPVINIDSPFDLALAEFFLSRLPGLTGDASL